MPSSEQNQLADRIEFTEQTSDSLHLLLKNISSLNRAVELQSVVRESIEVIQNVMNTEASSLILVDQNTGELVVSLPTGPVKKEIKGQRLPKGTGIGGWVIENDQSYYSNDVEESDIFAGDLSEQFETKNIICVPLRKKNGEIIGVLQAINRPDDTEFDERDLVVFEALADHVAIAIERTRELEKIQHQLNEKEMMLTEVHHRIKNNLSTLTALVEMEISSVDDKKSRDVLKKTCSRIESVTEVHDLLYNTGLTNNINLGSYLGKLTDKISDMLADPSQEVAIEIEADDIEIDTERAMSCGLLMNELLVNCYKHAFKNTSEEGNILVDLNLNDSKYVTLKVSDNGQGVGEDFKFEDSDSIGGWLINVLLRRLEASIDINQVNGTSFRVRFEK